MEHREYAFLLEDVMHNNFTYGYAQEDLWKLALNKKVIKYNMTDVKHWIYKTPWSSDECFFSIYQVLQQPKQFPDHIKRIKNANLSYPLIVIDDKYDKYGSILDGNHRFAKMILENRNFVNIVKLTKNDLKKIRIKLE